MTAGETLVLSQSMKSMKRIDLRLPDGLAARVELAAMAEHRSVNGQIVWMLSQAVEAEDDPEDKT